jgi:hypothetical protein
MTPVTGGVRPRLRWPGLALVVGITLQGCAAQAPGPASSPESIAGEAAAEVPPGATRIGDELYQLPIGTDDDGCPRYRLYSPTRLVAQVIYYREAGGGFTTDRRQAHCARDAPD